MSETTILYRMFFTHAMEDMTVATLFKTFNSWFRFHALAMALSLAVALIVAAPPFVYRHDPSYRGVDMMKTNTETHYLAHIQELYDGHFGLGNPYLGLDAKDEPYVFPPLGIYLTFGLGKLLGVSAVKAVMVLRFFFVGLLSFFVYYFTFQLTKQRMAGLVAAPFVILGYSMVNPMHIISILRGDGLLIEKTFIDYGRPVTPQVTSIFFFGYCILLWQAISGAVKQSRYALFGAAVILGASFYSYLFTWTFIFSLNGFLMLVYAGKKEWWKVRRIGYISAGAFFMGIPYLLHTYAISQHPWYEEAASRFGFVASRTPNVSRLVVGAALLFAVMRRRLPRELQLFFLAFFLTAIFVVNEQVITGQYVFNDHYHWYYSTPLVIILLVVLLYRLLAEHRVASRVITALLVAVFFGYGASVQAVSYREARAQVVEEQRYAPVIQWLEEEHQKDRVVVAPLPLAHMIPALTHANVYYTGSALYTLVPTERLLHAYLVYAFLNHVPRDELGARREDLSDWAYGYAYYFQKGVCMSCFPDAVLVDLARRYQDFSAQTFVAEVKRYPVDYIVWDKKNDPAWDVDRMGLPRVEDFGDIEVYALMPASPAPSVSDY